MASLIDQSKFDVFDPYQDINKFPRIQQLTLWGQHEITVSDTNQIVFHNPETRNQLGVDPCLFMPNENNGAFWLLPIDQTINFLSMKDSLANPFTGSPTDSVYCPKTEYLEGDTTLATGLRSLNKPKPGEYIAIGCGFKFEVWNKKDLVKHTKLIESSVYTHRVLDKFESPLDQHIFIENDQNSIRFLDPSHNNKSFMVTFGSDKKIWVIPEDSWNEFMDQYQGALVHSFTCWKQLRLTLGYATKVKAKGGIIEISDLPLHLRKQAQGALLLEKRIRALPLNSLVPDLSDELLIPVPESPLCVTQVTPTQEKEPNYQDDVQIALEFERLRSIPTDRGILLTQALEKLGPEYLGKFSDSKKKYKLKIDKKFIATLPLEYAHGGSEDINSQFRSFFAVNLHIKGDNALYLLPTELAYVIARYWLQKENFIEWFNDNVGKAYSMLVNQHCRKIKLAALKENFNLEPGDTVILKECGFGLKIEF